MLIKDPAKRATLKDILKHSWVTNNGEETVDADKIDDHNDLGNIRRLVQLRKISQGTFREKRFPPLEHDEQDLLQGEAQSIQKIMRKWFKIIYYKQLI